MIVEARECPRSGPSSDSLQTRKRLHGQTRQGGVGIAEASGVPGLRGYMMSLGTLHSVELSLRSAAPPLGAAKTTRPNICLAQLITGRALKEMSRGGIITKEATKSWPISIIVASTRDIRAKFARNRPKTRPNAIRKTHLDRQSHKATAHALPESTDEVRARA